MIQLKELTIKKTREHFLKGDFSATELSVAYLDEITKKNNEVNAYLEVYSDVLDVAKEVDKKIKENKNTNVGVSVNGLLGIPLAIKDNILIKGKRASSASKILENYSATYDATVITKLKNAGAIFLGRTNMDEFAMGGSTENSAFGVTKNPCDLSRVAGGSSGGSAAAVAMDGALAALGSDTGGSVRQPASFCGVVGLKPTYGSVSRYGLMAMGSSLDQIGPITKTVGDAEIIFNFIKGNDPKDGTTIKENTYLKNAQKGKKKMKIGVPYSFLKDGIDAEVLENFEKSIKKFKDIGYEIEDVVLPNISFSLPVYYIIMPAEVSSNLARFDGVKYGLYKEGESSVGDYFKTRGAGFGREVRRRIILGTYILSAGYYDAYYNKAGEVRMLLRKDFEEAFEKVDLILTPTTPSPAFKIGEKTADPLQMYLSDIFTVTANLVGIPAISIPSGFVEKNNKKLPLGIQISANFGREDLLFESGKDFFGE